MKGREYQEKDKISVYDHIRMAILRNDYPGGAFIEEIEVSEKIGVSRTPVREAFRRLNAEEYIELLPRRGARVRQVTLEEVEGMFEARLIVEGAAVDQICKKKIPLSPSIPDIIQEMKRMEKNLKSIDDKIRFTELDWEFHCAIVGMCNNKVLNHMFHSIRSIFERVAKTIEKDIEHQIRVNREHVTLMGYLQVYDSISFKELLGEHLRKSNV